MVKNNNSLLNNLSQNANKSQNKNQKELLDNLLKPERKELQILLKNLYKSGYEISFRNKKNKKNNDNTLRIRKTINGNEKHYGLISNRILNKNKNDKNLFGYCLDFEFDYCPNDFPYNILGFPQDNGWYIYTEKDQSKLKEYLVITSIELAHKIFNI
jgi:hypothetical protein